MSNDETPGTSETRSARISPRAGVEVDKAIGGELITHELKLIPLEHRVNFLIIYSTLRRLIHDVLIGCLAARKLEFVYGTIDQNHFLWRQIYLQNISAEHSLHGRERSVRQLYAIEFKFWL